ncbi:RagB/SusD family nutrient uptake outer membrane protein [Maribellus sp. CM-23]|uniref:RagB/SusD family nutrient uptake outer membrane protein n=1 Tax=Maribellus sp. CM-23 TaxID=2781026 RepID=UPI001F158304|nr:RagB/SusD family nutrient uptake outer membrane protein [Maribellus sp. CM-23]MCE4565517.1 RagB/SusD family nutrient uptake outer membrane protein [Maribellus sp. CM-23]
MKIRNFKYQLLALFTLLLLGACSEEYLNPEPRTVYTEAEIWKTKENTYLYINGFYKPIYEYGPYGKKYAGVALNDGFSDIVKYNQHVMGANGGDVNKTILNPIISPTGIVLSDYQYEYNRIRRINEFLYGLENYVTYSNEDKVLMEAQARFFRGFLHFMLVRSHGGIIIRDYIDGPNEAYKARSTESECYDFITKELDFAAENLPAQWEAASLGRLTKGAVYGYKSRVMLYAERWQEAVDAAEEVIKEEDNLYQLESDYDKIFKTRDSKEGVLSYRFGGTLGHSFHQLYCPKGDKSEGVIGIAGPTLEMVDSYRMADGSEFDWNNPEHAANPYANREPRFYASVLYNGASWKGRTIETFVGGQDGFEPYAAQQSSGGTTTGYYIRKMLDENAPMDQVSAQTWYEVRYAEVLLNHAEALNELGRGEDALVSLNKVRTRAKLPKITVSDKEALREIIREERKVELAFEGQRYWDLRRWKLATEVLNGVRMHGTKITKDGDSFIYETVECDDKDRVFKESYYKLPVPQNEIDNNPLCKQTPLW